VEQLLLRVYFKKGEEPKRESHFTYKFSFTTLLKEPNSRIRSYFVIADTSISLYLSVISFPIVFASHRQTRWETRCNILSI